MSTRDSHCKPRIPKRSFTKNRGYGWHVSYPDPVSGMLRRHGFGIWEQGRKAEAERLYHDWAGKHLGGETPEPVVFQNSSVLQPRGAKQLAWCVVEAESTALTTGHLETEQLWTVSTISGLGRRSVPSSTARGMEDCIYGCRLHQSDTFNNRASGGQDSGPSLVGPSER